MDLAPERPGQPRMMTVAYGIKAGHWYSPEAVREMLEAERERCAKVCEGIQQRDADRQVDSLDQLEDTDFYSGGVCAAEDCAEAIRALGNP